MDVITVESCHSTWIFDPDRMRFCRILKGIQVAYGSVSTDWRPYWNLEVDPDAETFCVYLNPVRHDAAPDQTLRHTQTVLSAVCKKPAELSLEDSTPQSTCDDAQHQLSLRHRSHVPTLTRGPHIDPLSLPFLSAYPQSPRVAPLRWRSGRLLAESDLSEAASSDRTGFFGSRILIFENRWATAVLQALRRGEAELVCAGYIPQDDLVAALDAAEG